MARVLDVSAYFIKLSSMEIEKYFLTLLQLQKLLYYAQGWSLALYDKPLFRDAKIHAWVHGPVVPMVYFRLAKYGNWAIPSSAVSQNPVLTEKERDFIETVWNAYKKYSARALTWMIDSDLPWIEARRSSYNPAEKSSTEITHEALKKFFTGKKFFTRLLNTLSGSWR